jgi:hypothetical protein
MLRKDNQPCLEDSPLSRLDLQHFFTSSTTEDKHHGETRLRHCKRLSLDRHPPAAMPTTDFVANGDVAQAEDQTVLSGDGSSQAKGVVSCGLKCALAVIWVLG